MRERIAGSSAEDRIVRIARSYRESAVLLAAARLRLFEPLVGDALEARSVARRLRLDGRAATVILDALAGMGVLSKRRGLYALTAGARRILDPASPRYLGHLLDHHFNLVSDWTRLPDVAKAGAPIPWRKDRRERREHRDFILAMANIGRDGARAVLEAIDLSDRRRMLDLGGGPGVYAIEFCRRHRRLEAVVFDRRGAASIARSEIRRAGLERRIRPRSGDFLEDPIGAGYDLVLLSAVLHSYPPRTILQLLRKARRAMEQGGLLLIRDREIGPDGTRPLEAALFSVNLLVRTREGSCLTASRMKGAMRRAGFHGIGRIPLEDGMTLYHGHR